MYKFKSSAYVQQIPQPAALYFLRNLMYTGRVLVLPSFIRRYGQASLGVHRKGERADCRLRREKGSERVAAVEKIEETRKPDDFFGHRNRTRYIMVATSF